MNEHPDWTTRIFDFGKGEVQSFLISNAVYWLEQYHIDGLRVDAVAAMLYLDYGRREYRPNKFGGKENLEAIAFLRKLNRAVFSVRRGAITAAEESTAFPLVTKPDYDGGLGFTVQMEHGLDERHAALYARSDPLFRKGMHDNDLTFSMTYAYSEELHISRFRMTRWCTASASLINKMPGEYDDKFSNLRVFYGFMMGHPGQEAAASWAANSRSSPNGPISAGWIGCCWIIRRISRCRPMLRRSTISIWKRRSSGSRIPTGAALNGSVMRTTAITSLRSGGSRQMEAIS